jgi:phosphoglycolate phosphatase
MRIVVFWDLDGTILTTNRGGVAALEDAAEQVLGQRPDLSQMRTAGMTDAEIARSIVSVAWGRTDDEAERAFLGRYADALPARLEERRGHVMPNVPEILAACDRDDAVTLGLLTGNIAGGARAKLASYGLDADVFPFGGFAEDGHSRVEIGRVALARAGGREAWDRAFLIGDTPSDVDAGKHLDLSVIAVATGVHTLDELAALDPWRAVPHLPEAEAFLALLETG